MIGSYTTPILLYHKIDCVSEDQDPLRLSVSPALFAQQMQWLADGGYRCLTLQEVYDCWQAGRYPRKSFALTFDDAYADTYTTVLPILQQHGFTATIFAVSDFIGRNLPWPSPQHSQFLTVEQMLTMQASGMVFGGHTVTHPILSHLPIEAATAEITQNRLDLATKLGQEIAFFSYPFGNHSAAIEQAVAAAGYTAALGVDIDEPSRWNLWRIQINSDDGPRLFQLKVSGYFEHLKRFRQQSRVTWLITQFFGKALSRNVNNEATQ